MLCRGDAGMSAKTKRHMGRVAALPCCLCGSFPVEVHHARTGEAAGMAQRAGDMLTLPVCPSCHRGSHGLHGNRAMLNMTKKTELDHANDTLERLYG